MIVRLIVVVSTAIAVLTPAAVSSGLTLLG
jgi:hypothetical protein